MSTNYTSTTRHLERPEGRIGYDVEGSGPLVVCIPGMGDLRSTYRFLAPALVDAGYRVATFDLRGHGDSDPTFSSYDDEAAASDTVALVEHLGGPAVVVGNSMGAGAAVIAAALRPELVSALVLMGPFVRIPPMSRVKVVMFRLLMARPWARPVWRSYLPTLYAGRKPADFDEYRERVVASIAEPGKTAAFAKTSRTSHAPAEAATTEVMVPALVVMGRLDPDFDQPELEAQWVAEALSAQIVMVDEAGHYPQSQRPDVVNPAVVMFLQTEVPGA